jgi:hypothetical protein
MSAVTTYIVFDDEDDPPANIAELREEAAAVAEAAQALVEALAGANVDVGDVCEQADGLVGTATWIGEMTQRLPGGTTRLLGSWKA